MLMGPPMMAMGTSSSEPFTPIARSLTNNDAIFALDPLVGGYPPMMPPAANFGGGYPPYGRTRIKRGHRSPVLRQNGL